jgi:hypothetical protein
LIGGFALLLITQAITPNFQKTIPEEFKIESPNLMTLRFERPKIIKYIFIPTSNSWTNKQLKSMLIKINGDKALIYRYDYHFARTDNGVRIIFPTPKTVTYADIAFRNTTELTQVLKEKPFGVRVDYGWSLPWLKNKPSNSTFFGDGWSGQEKWGRWMVKKNAKLGVPAIPYISQNEFRVRIKGHGFVVKGYQPEVVVDVIFNKTKLGEMYFNIGDGVKVFEFVLPEGSAEFIKENHIEFVVHNTLSPAQAGLSGDRRQLSFGLIEFEVLSNNAKKGN